MRELLRRCPSCGRRFTVRIESKKLVDAEQGSERVVHDVVVVPILAGSGSRTAPVGVAYGEIPIEREEFDVTYECKNCHHEWTERISKVEESK